MGSTLRFNTLMRYLIPASLFYLSLPFIIFFIGWLKWYFSFFGVSLVLLGLFCCIRGINQIVKTESDWISGSTFGFHHIILVLLVVLLLLGISGVGGYGYQDTDWIKHNAILKDLITQPWPVDYQMGGQEVPLVYYIAYYLPAAFVGKLGGWFLANQALFVWSFIGLTLALLWFLVLNRRFTFTVVLLFVMFSGLDVVGEGFSRLVVAAIRPEVRSVLSWGHIEQWSIGWQYSSNATLLFWAPHQALVGWIASGAVMYGILNSQQRKYSLLYLGLTTLWSPFVTLGLLPYLLAEFLLADGNLSKRLQQYISMPNLCGLVLAAVIGLFYSSKLYEISSLSTGVIPGGFSLAFASDAQARIIGIMLLLVFCLFEFGLYAFLILRARRDWDRKTGVLFATTLPCLLLIPLYRYGGVNDFVMRASIPALFALAVFVGRTLHSQSPGRLAHIFLIALVILGSITAVVEFRRHIIGIITAGSVLRTPMMDQVLGVSQWGIFTEKDATIVLQYVGSSAAPFFVFLAK
jgi:hypothetical protein